jgi:cytochrome P450
VFSSDSIDPLDPDPAYRFIPTLINPPEHVKYRQVLNPWFAPAAVNRIAHTARKICADDIDRFADQGSCDFIADFALRYPTEVFLTVLGLPVDDASLFLPWVETFFEGLYGEDKSHIPDVADSIRGYFADVLAARRKQSGDPDTDFVSYLMKATVFDRPLTDDELLDICWVLVLADWTRREASSVTWSVTSLYTTTTAAAWSRIPPSYRGRLRRACGSIRSSSVMVGRSRRTSTSMVAP